ncbi:MAG: hypothetical protein IT427_11375 [Pirellulales bacterium]|nr:hypothetical protein [Pirellulales bacterium]
MKKLLILTALTAFAGASLGCSCCGLGRRVEYCPPSFDACDECGPACDSCQPGGIGTVIGPSSGGTVITNPPPTYVPGPASTTRYLPR